jgi:hypothetical protein
MVHFLEDTFLALNLIEQLSTLLKCLKLSEDSFFLLRRLGLLESTAEVDWSLVPDKEADQFKSLDSEDSKQALLAVSGIF